MTGMTLLQTDPIRQLAFSVHQNKGVFAVSFGSGLSRAANPHWLANHAGLGPLSRDRAERRGPVGLGRWVPTWRVALVTHPRLPSKGERPIFSLGADTIGLTSEKRACSMACCSDGRLQVFCSRRLFMPAFHACSIRLPVS